MEVRPGYKKTEVGVIPESWNATQLKKISPLQSVGLVINPSTYVVNDGTVPMLVGSDVSANSINWENARRISETSNKMLPASRLYAGDLVTVRVGEPGITAVIPPELDGCNCASMMIVRQHKTFDSHWLCYMMNSRSGLAQVENVQYGTAQKQFNISDAINFTYATPPLAEQRAIATALSDVDALLAAQDKLIAKKRDIKQAAMQQLLTGKQRLPGFSGEWEVKQLGVLADVIKGNGLSKAEISNQGVRKCILYGELFTSYGRIITSVVNATNSENGQPSKYGDVLVPGSTTTTGIDLATASALLQDDVALGGDINIIRKKRADSFDSIFFANYITHAKKRDIADRAQGITIIHLYGRDLLSMELSIPSLEEQTAIATVLSDMDAELTALETQRDKTRSLKQGMMQELLTGRIRLV